MVVWDWVSQPLSLSGGCAKFDLSIWPQFLSLLELLHALIVQEDATDVALIPER